MAEHPKFKEQEGFIALLCHLVEELCLSCNTVYGVCHFAYLHCRCRFALETLAVWAVLCLPINLLTCYMVTVAPDYDHLAQGCNSIAI